jgi:hypothetical protein
MKLQFQTVFAPPPILTCLFIKAIFRTVLQTKSGFTWLALLLCVPSLTAQSPQTTIVGVKLLKEVRGSDAPPLQIELPEQCSLCSVMHGPFYEGQNQYEAFFYLKVPVSQAQIANIKVNVGDLKVRSLVVEKSYLHFRRDGDQLTFDLPIAPRARSSTLEVQSSLNWPGMTVRIEHAFEGRRAGKYATGPWPALQRQAALNLEFGLREAIRALGLDREVCERGLGRIHLMGFDTNFPLGHEDFPPHIHMILRWPHYAGSQAPHLYVSDTGLLEGDVKVTMDGLPEIAATSFPQGTSVPAIDYLGETLYQIVENTDGTLTLQRSNADSCTLRPLQAGTQGFASGVEVKCSTGKAARVSASDDSEAGILRVSVDSNPSEIYRFDPDTAVLLSSLPSLPASSFGSCSGDAPKQGN